MAAAAEEALVKINAVLPEAARDRQLRATLQPPAQAIPNHLMRAANRDVDVAGISVEEAARRLRDRIASSRR